MSRMTNMLAALVLGLLPLACAQDSRPGPQVPEEALTTRELIAWSGLQKPQPAPQPLPPRDTPIPQPDQSPDQQANPPASPHSDQTPTQSFTGKIVKDGGRYALKAGSRMYQLSEQDGLQKYENQAVRIVGSLDPSSDTIRVQKIELLS